MKIITPLINSDQRLTGCVNSYEREIPVYDDGSGPIWVLEDSLGLTALIRADSFESAFEIAEDEFFSEASDTVEELKKEYSWWEECERVVDKDGVFVEWKSTRHEIEDGDTDRSFADNKLFQEGYGFRPNGPNARDVHKHGIYEKDLNGESLYILTEAERERLELTLKLEDW
jgi:hypothetical protein